MSEPNNQLNSPSTAWSDPNLRKLLYAAIVVFAILPLVAVLVLKTKTPAEAELVEPEAPVQPARVPPRSKRSQTIPAPREVSIWDTTNTPAPPKTFATIKRAGAEKAPPANPPANSDPKQLLGRLLEIDDGALTPAQAKEINELLDQIASLGTAAIPAIQEYLEQGQNMNFDTLEGGELVNFPSLRIALLDALAEIGGPQALATIAQSLNSVADPLEIALVANELGHQAPGQYQQAAVTAARRILAGGLTGRDVSPLFEVLQTYGDATVVKDLEQSAQRYNYYATMALAALPDGAGIPSLIKLAQDPAITALGNGDFALRILAQTSIQYPDAWAALSQQATANLIPDTAWPTVASSLAGNHLQFGNPVYDNSSAPATWTNAQISQRITMIDQLLSATTNPVAIQSLQKARATLVTKLKS